MDNIRSANRPVSSPINYGVIPSSPVPETSPIVAAQQQQHNHLGVHNRYAGSSTFSNFGQESSEPSSLTTSITTTTSTTAATTQISRQSLLSSAESIMTNSNNTKGNKVFKTEYKENFKPFDQYVYNEVTDTFVRSDSESHQTKQQNLISTPNNNIKSSTSNQDLALSSMNEQNLLSLQNTHDASTFEPNQAQSSTEKASNGSTSNNVANEPWYKEVIKRNEKANEYRFKSELGHNSHILNYTTANNIDDANKNQGTDPETGNTNGSDETTDNKQALEAGSNLSIRQPVVYRYKRDNMIAHMAKNNNFKLPKEPADTVNSTTNRVKTPVNGSAAPSHLRSLTRSTAQSRARSQSSRQPVSTTPNGAQNSQTTKKADSTNTTPTRTPTYVTSKSTKQSNLTCTPRPSPATVASSKLASNKRALNTSATNATISISANVRDTSKRVATAKPSSSNLNSKSGIITKKSMTTQTAPNTEATSKTNVMKNSIPVKSKTPITTSRNIPNVQANVRSSAVSKMTTTNKQFNSTQKPVSILAPIAKQLDSPTSVKSNGLLKKEMAPVESEIAQATKPLDEFVTSTVTDDILNNNDEDNKAPSIGSEAKEEKQDKQQQQQEQAEPQQQQIKEEIQRKSSNVGGLGTSAIQTDVQSEIKNDEFQKKFDTSDDSMNNSQDKLDTTDDMINENINFDKPKVDELILSPMQLADLSNDNLPHNISNEALETLSNGSDHSQRDQVIEPDGINEQELSDHSDTRENDHVNDEKIPEPVVEEISKKHEDEVYSSQVELDVDQTMVDNDEEDESEGKHIKQYMDDYLKNNMADPVPDEQHDIFDSEAEIPKDFDTTPIESDEQVRQILDEIDGLKMNITDYIASKEVVNDINLDTEKPAPTAEAIDTNLQGSDIQKPDLTAPTDSEYINEDDLLASDSPPEEPMIDHDETNLLGSETSTIDTVNEKLHSEIDLLGGTNNEQVQKTTVDDVKTTEYEFVLPSVNNDLYKGQPEHTETKRSSINLEGQSHEEEPYSILELDSKPDDQEQQKVDVSDMLLDFSGNSSNSTDVSKIVHPDTSPLNPIDLMAPEKVDIPFTVDHPIIEDSELLDFDHVSSEKSGEHKEEDKIISSEEK